MKNKKVLILSIVCILVVVVILGILYFTTDLFKTEQQLFYKYLSHTKVINYDFFKQFYTLNNMISKESNSSTDSKDNESKSSTEKDNKNSDVESKKSDAKKESSKKSGSETKADNNSDNNKTQSSENKVMSKTDAVNKILSHEISGSIPKYCIPVKAVGEDYSVLEKSEGSNAFLCNDDNKLDNGVLVELMDFNGGNDSNNFVIRDYNAMKNGGKGLISSGSISNSGEVKSK